MEIQVDLESSKVNDAIARAVVESRLGDALKERLEKFFEGQRGIYGSPSLSTALENAVDAELRRILMELIRNDYSEAIKEKVREKMTEDVISELVTKAIDKLNSRY